MVLLVLAALVAPPLQAASLPEDISRQLLEFRFNSRDPVRLNQRIEESHTELRLRAAQEPTKETKAVLIFSKPLLQAELQELAHRYHLKVTAVRHTTITRDRNFGGEFATLDSFAGEFGDKIDFFTHRLLASIDDIINGKLPFQQAPAESGFTQPAISAAVQALAERKQRILDVGLEFYEMQAVGTPIEYLRLQQSEPSVAAMRLIKSIPLPEEMIQELNKKFPKGIPKLPLPPLTQEKLGQQQQHAGAGVISRGTSRSSVETTSGFLCGPNSGNPNEFKCPPDYTFAPAKEEDGGGRYFQVILQPYWAGLFGWATAGGFQTWIQWSPQTDGGIVTNTAAFKEDSILPHCNPIRSGASAPCSNPNSVFVSQAAYESELLIPNPTCFLPNRTGDPVDRLFGCFVGADYDSSFPGTDYLDTTFSDAIPAPEVHPHGDGTNPYNAAVGAFQANQLSSGVLYHTWIYALTLGLNGPAQVSGKVVRLTGQIGTSDTDIPCMSGAETFCVFAVDSTKLTETTFP